jgi:hypothetical protein
MGLRSARWLEHLGVSRVGATEPRTGNAERVT